MEEVVSGDDPLCRPLKRPFTSGILNQLANGKPIEVETTVEVYFVLMRAP